MSNNGKFLPDAGIVKDARCGICDSEMDVTRGLTGHTSWAGRMASKHCENPPKPRNYDFFVCPHFDKEWHRKAGELLNLAATTPSPTLAKIYEDDAAHIMKMGFAAPPIKLSAAARQKLDSQPDDGRQGQK